QWGDETFLDLVESIALLSTDSALLLLCVARPELVERRPAWPGTLRLQPLASEDADALIGDDVSPELRDRIAHAAGGNPLFISEMLAMAAGNQDVEVPPTLKALLAARLDQLDEAERRVLERGRPMAERAATAGSHLAQATRYRAELGAPAPELADRASARLAAAGHRAIDRGDSWAGYALLTRAAELIRPHRLDLALELESA